MDGHVGEIEGVKMGTAAYWVQVAMGVQMKQVQEGVELAHGLVFPYHEVAQPFSLLADFGLSLGLSH